MSEKDLTLNDWLPLVNSSTLTGEEAERVAEGAFAAAENGSNRQWVFVLEDLCANSRVPANVLERVYSYGYGRDRDTYFKYVEETVVGNPNAPRWILEDCIDSGVWERKVWVLGNRALPADLFAHLLRDEDVSFVALRMFNRKRYTTGELNELYKCLTGDSETVLPDVGVSVLKSLIVSLI